MNGNIANKVNEYIITVQDCNFGFQDQPFNFHLGLITETLKMETNVNECNLGAQCTGVNQHNQ